MVTLCTRRYGHVADSPACACGLKFRCPKTLSADLSRLACRCRGSCRLLRVACADATLQEQIVQHFAHLFSCRDVNGILPRMNQASRPLLTRQQPLVSSLKLSCHAGVCGAERSDSIQEEPVFPGRCVWGQHPGQTCQRLVPGPCQGGVWRRSACHVSTQPQPLIVAMHAPWHPDLWGEKA